MSGQFPPLYGISSSDHGAYPVISTAIWICLTGLTVAIRLTLGWNRNAAAVAWDDISFGIAAALAIASLALYPFAVHAGLGRHIGDLDTHSITRFYKILYAAHIIGIAAIASSKVSAALLCRRAVLLKPEYFYSLIGVVVVWATFAVFATLFRCQLPDPWVSAPPNCPWRGYLEYSITAFNIITDVVLSVWIIRPVWRISMPKQDRLTVVILFGARILIPCIAVGQLITIAPVIHSSDQTWVNVPFTLFNQAIPNLSVILATLPRVNRFLYCLRDNLIFPRISKYELGQHSSPSPPESHAAPRPTSSPPASSDTPLPAHSSETQRLTAWSSGRT